MNPIPFWLGALLIVAAVALQAGIAPVPIALGLALALSLRSRLPAALGWAAGSGALLEIVSIAPVGSIALPMVIAAGATQLASARWLRATGPWRTAAVVLLGSAVAAGSDAALQGWELHAALRVGALTFVFAAAWLIIVSVFVRG